MSPADSSEHRMLKLVVNRHYPQCSRAKHAVLQSNNVTDRPAVDAAIDSVCDGRGAIQIVVTSAGVTAFESFTDISIEQWNRTLAINLTGTFNCVQAAIPDMISAGWGRIVTISSAAGQTAHPTKPTTSRPKEA